MKEKKIAIVCDWITDSGGAENVLEDLCTLFPHADIFSSVFFPRDKNRFAGSKVITSIIQKIPIFNKNHTFALLLRPVIFENFDLSEYDIVISSSSAESKGVITKSETIHICYCHTPVRYFWSHYHQYMNRLDFGIGNIFIKFFFPKIISSLREWDFLAAKRPDFFLANSYNTQKRIQKYYGRDSQVIYPGICVEDFIYQEKKHDFYLAVGRCVSYKRFDLIVDTFNKNGKKLILATSITNTLQKKLAKKSLQNIEWRIGISNTQKNDLLAKAKAFIFPVDDDFGITPLEAMASGTPVIVYKKGGALETVVPGKTGIFFEQQTVSSLNHAIKKFENLNFSPKSCKKQAEKFDKKFFYKAFLDFLKTTHDM